MIVILRAPLRALSALVLLLVGLTGCGGGGSAVTNKPVSTDTRYATFAAIDQKISALTSTPAVDATQALADFMKSRPEFEDAGVSDDGCAWGRFTDGRVVVIAMNRPTINGKAAPLPAATHGRALSGLPGSRTMRFLDTMGPAYAHPAQTIQDQLSTRGYDPPQVIVKTGTIEDFKQVQGDGIFYLSAHGGTGYERGSGNGSSANKRRIFGVWTATPIDKRLDQQYLADLNANRLIYFKGKYFNESTKNYPDGEAWHYAITPAFVAAYMKFGPNSLVYMDACASDNAGFKSACLSAGAGIYVGWTAPVGDFYSTPTVQFCFDRLLGANAVAPIDPSNPPPLDWQSAQAAMANTLIPGTQFHYGHSPSVNPAKYPEAQLTFTQGQGDLGVIVPSITSVEVPDFNTRDVTLTGLFGNTTGTAAMNATATSPGSPLTVVSWAPTQVVVKVTDTTQTVQVSVNGRTSNIAAVPASSARIDPTAATLLNNSQQAFKASTDAKLAPGASLAYHWSTTGKFGILSDANGHGGVSFDTTASQALYTANPSGTGNDTVTVEIIQVLGNRRKSLGPAVAMVTVADAVQQVSLTLSNLDPSLQGVIPAQATVPAYGVSGEQYAFRDGKNLVTMNFYTTPDINPSQSVHLALPFTGDLTVGMQISAAKISDFFPDVLQFQWPVPDPNVLAVYFSAQSGTVTITGISGPIGGNPYDHIVTFTVTAHMLEVGGNTGFPTPRTFDIQVNGACEVDNLNNPQGRAAFRRASTRRATQYPGPTHLPYQR